MRRARWCPSWSKVGGLSAREWGGGASTFLCVEWFFILLIHRSTIWTQRSRLRGVAVFRVGLVQMPFSFLLLPLFTMKYALTESELNLNCPCLEAILLVWPPFGGIGLQVSGGGQTFSPRAGRTRSGLTCGLPVRILTHTRQARDAGQASRRQERPPPVRAKWWVSIPHSAGQTALPSRCHRGGASTRTSRTLSTAEASYRSTFY